MHVRYDDTPRITAGGNTKYWRPGPYDLVPVATPGSIARYEAAEAAAAEALKARLEAEGIKVQPPPSGDVEACGAPGYYGKPCDVRVGGGGPCRWHKLKD